jgi:hypothetical protein
LLVKRHLSILSAVIFLETQLEALDHLKPELNPTAQRCTARFFTGDFAF